jgi:hypothetical protein
MAKMDPRQLLTDEEIQSVILNFTTVRGDLGATKAELEKIVEWAQETACMKTLLELVLLGRVDIDLKDGVVMFRQHGLERVH